MAKEDEEFKRFMRGCFLITFIALFFLIIFTAVTVIRVNRMSDKAEKLIEIPETFECEYKDKDLYFKGSCNDVKGLIDLNRREEDFEKYMDSFENYCEDTLIRNFYYGCREHSECSEMEEIWKVSFEEFKEKLIEDSEFMMFIELMCERRK